MTREEIIGKIRDHAGFFYMGDTRGYGSWGQLLYVGEQGVEDFGSYDGGVEERYITGSKYAEVSRAIAEGNEEDCDENDVRMVRHGLQPDTKYWTLSAEFTHDDEPLYFTSEEEALSAMVEGCDACLTEWNDMDDEELEEWLKVVEAHRTTGGSCLD